MNHTIHRPPAPLDRYVDFLWTSDSQPARTPRERVLPTGAQSLIVHLGAQPIEIYADESSPVATRLSGSLVCGARKSPLIVGAARGPTVGAQFKPGGARAFFGVPAHELSEHTPSLDALWGAAAHRLQAQLHELTSPLARLRRLQDALRARCLDAEGAPPALTASLRAFELAELESVAQVHRHTGLSPKRLLALFRDEVGLTPKSYWRVRRFRAALRDFEGGRARGADLAHDHGCFDQAHWLREFRALTGSNPREYLACRVAGTDHVALPGQNIQDAAAT